jgi:hypothetical protein
MISYQGLRMDSPRTIALLNALLALMAERDQSAESLTQQSGIKASVVKKYLKYLCLTGRAVVATPACYKPGRTSRATYRVGPVTAPPPESVEEVYGRDASAADQRHVPADRWERGQHAHRSGLLAAFFPLGGGE